MAYVNIVYTFFIGAALIVSTILTSVIVFSATINMEFAYTFLHITTAIILAAAISGFGTRKRSIQKFSGTAGTLVGLVFVCAALAALLATVARPAHGQVSLHPAIVQFLFLQASVLYHLCTPQENFSNRVWFFIIANIWCAICATGADLSNSSPEVFVAATTGVASGTAVIISLICRTSSVSRKSMRAVRADVGNVVLQVENLFAIYYVKE